MTPLMSPSAHARGDGYTGPLPTVTYPLLGTPLRPAPTVLVVGYPAPAAVQIVERLITTDARPVTCVVPHDRWAEASQMHRGAQDSGRLRLLEGRADAPGLGLSCAARRLLDTTEEIYAVTSAPEIAAGHIQDFADECPRLRELHVVARDAALSPRSAWGALRRSLSVPAPVRASLRKLTAACTLGVASVAPVVRAVSPWKTLLDFDIETALSGKDLERDLWPGLGHAD